MRATRHWRHFLVLGIALAGCQTEKTTDSPDPSAAPPPAAPTVVGAVEILPGTDIQSLVDAHAENTKFLLKAGIHRMQSVTPKNGDEFVGESGAILSGARLLTQFEREGSYFVASHQTQEGQVHGECRSGFSRCNRPEDFFIDDERLEAVASLAEVRAGTFYFDYSSDKIYFLDNPNGKKVETSVSRAAFYGRRSGSVIRGVRISNLTIEKYAVPAQMGAIGEQFPGENWTLENLEIRQNHGGGLRIGSGSTARANYIHHNGQIGVLAQGAGSLIESNEVAFNNTAHYSSSWEAGGTKFALTTDLQVRCNFVHHNDGPGLWTDIDNLRTLYEYNLVTHNAEAGIFHEISFDAIIRNNTVKANAQANYPWLYGAQILISTSQNAEVLQNKVEVAPAGGNGITIIQQNRGGGSLGAYLAKNNFVHHNQITYLASRGSNPTTPGGNTEIARSGAAQDFDGANFWSNGNNRFDFNVYHMPTITADHFEWNNQQTHWSTIRSAGVETHGSIDTFVVADTLPAAVPACPH